MTERLGSRLTRAAWRVWQAALVVNTTIMLTVAVYAGMTSPDDGPSATPFLMAGLLSLGVFALAGMSAVNALLWGSATQASWWRRIALVLAAFAGAVLILQCAIYASDHHYPTTRRVCLVLFPVSVLAAHLLNRAAVRVYRRRRTSAT